MRLTVALCAAGASLVLLWGLARGEERVVLLPPVAASKPDAAKTPKSDAPATPATDETTDERDETASPAPAVTEEPAAEPDSKGAGNKTLPWIPEFMGDQTPIGSLLRLPAGQIQGHGLIYAPSARYFKISDNDSPRPQSRTYFSFNYFYDLGDTINRMTAGGIQHTRIHREIFGWEWANADGTASIGLRLPIQTYNASGPLPGLDGASTDIGDLSIIFKWLLWQNPEGSLFSAGLAITPPTGPSPFAGSRDLAVYHNTCLQPYCGWIWSAGDFYLQGFTAVDAPTDLNDVVLLSNSIGAGYFLYQNHFNRGLTAVVPTLEVHVNTPLNHRGILRLTDPAGTPDMINITGGVQLEYQDKSSMGVAFAMPVTGPRMFNFEILAQFRWRY
jgi:hypothetical protein